LVADSCGTARFHRAHPPLDGAPRRRGFSATGPSSFGARRNRFGFPAVALRRKRACCRPAAAFGSEVRVLRLVVGDRHRGARPRGHRFDQSGARQGVNVVRGGPIRRFEARRSPWSVVYRGAAETNLRISGNGVVLPIGSITFNTGRLSRVPNEGAAALEIEDGRPRFAPAGAASEDTARIGPAAPQPSLQAASVARVRARSRPARQAAAVLPPRAALRRLASERDLADYAAAPETDPVAERPSRRTPTMSRSSNSTLRIRQAGSRTPRAMRSQNPNRGETSIPGPSQW
jgi:hypothetical protein